MIINTVTGNSFEGACLYLLKERAKILYQSGVFGDDPNSIAKQFQAIADGNKNISLPVWHSSISFAYQDKVDDKMMISIGKDFLKLMNFDIEDNQVLMVKHTDTHHAHFHILSNRIGFSENIVSDYYCKNKSASVSDKLELRYNLTIARLQPRQSKKEFITKKENIKAHLASKLHDAFKIEKVKSIKELSVFLLKYDIKSKLHVQSTGRVYGITFSKDLSFKGSSINKNYSLKGIINLLEINQKINKHKSLNIAFRPDKLLLIDSLSNLSKVSSINNLSENFLDENQENIKKKKKKKNRGLSHN